MRVVGDIEKCPLARLVVAGKMAVKKVALRVDEQMRSVLHVAGLKADFLGYDRIEPGGRRDNADQFDTHAAFPFGITVL
jgi:hypothetical protein